MKFLEIFESCTPAKYPTRPLCQKSESRTGSTYPGKDVDMQEDFEDWTISQLQERVELVQDFDKLADSIVKSYIDMCTNYNIIEEEIMVPRTIKVLEPIR